MVAAIEVAGAGPVYQEVVAARSSGEIAVLADLNEAVRAENCQAPIAPSVQTVWSQPIDSRVAHAAVAAYGDVAKILHL